MPLTTMHRVILALTGFRSPLLRTLVPCGIAAVTLQALAAAPSVGARSERFFDLSGSLTFLAVGALSLYLPSLRARALAAAGKVVAASSSSSSWLPPHPSIVQLVTGAGGRNWRQVLLVGMTMVWAVRLGSLLFSRVVNSGHDSRFDAIRDKPVRFASVFLVQAVWVTVQMLPVLALNAVPAAALAASSTVPRLLATDVVGLALWAGGFAFEAVADYQKNQWARRKKLKLHDEDFLTSGLFSVSRFPNYFGEITLWAGIATAAAGALARHPAQLALGWVAAARPLGIVATSSLCALTPLFTYFIITRVSGIPLSEKKYDERYGHRADYRAWRDSTPRLVPKLW